MSVCKKIGVCGKHTILYVSLVLLVVVSGCASFTKHGKLTKSATEAYQSGNYDAAVRYSTNALRIKPEYEDAQKVLVNSFPISIRNRESRIAELTSRTELESVDSLVKEYQIIIKISNDVRDLPPLVEKKSKKPIKFTFVDYSKSFMKAKENAAETYYVRGQKLGSIGGIENSKFAAKAFKKSQSYIPEYKDTVVLYEKFRLAGVKRIAILSFVNKSGHDQYGAIGDLVSDQITSTIMGTRRAVEFLKIISRTELEQSMRKHNMVLSGSLDDSEAIKIGESLGLHEIIVGQITQINVSQPAQTSKSVNEKNRVVIGSEKYQDKNGKTKTRSLYGDVYAKVNVFHMRANARITGSYKIIDIKTAQLKTADSFSGEYEYNHKWASFTGDKRGLSHNTQRLVRNDPGISPSEGDRVNKAAKQLVTSMSNKIIAYTE